MQQVISFTKTGDDLFYRNSPHTLAVCSEELHEWFNFPKVSLIDIEISDKISTGSIQIERRYINGIGYSHMARHNREHKWYHIFLTSSAMRFLINWERNHDKTYIRVLY